MAADLSLGSLILLERDYGSLISVNQKNGEPNWEKRFNYLKTAKFISFMSGNKFLVSGGLDNSIHVLIQFLGNMNGVTALMAKYEARRFTQRMKISLSSTPEQLFVR